MSPILTKLSIPQEDLTPHAITTATLHGTFPTKTTIVRNLLVTPLNGEPAIPLELAYTCPQLPDQLGNVPTPQEVSSIPGLSHLAEKFPSKENWPTLMLIGRDCAQSQKHLQTVSSNDKHQLAIQTPLGWTIMGKPAPYTSPLPTCQPHSFSTSFFSTDASAPNAQAPIRVPQPLNASFFTHASLHSTSAICPISVVHPQPQETLLNAPDEKPQLTEEEPPTTKRVRWQPKLTTIHEIETEGLQKPTSATLLQQREHASKKRTWCTNRSKRYRDQLVDWVITLHQLNALNSQSEPHCPSPRLILHRPKRTILQNPKRQESTSLPKPIPKGNAKPLTQRMAEYTHHKARILNHELRPGVFNFHFFPP